MITPVSTNKVWTPPNRDYFEKSSKDKKSFNEKVEDGFSKSHEWVDNTCGLKSAERLKIRTDNCTDKMASCSKRSLGNSTSTNSSIDTCVSSSKSVSHCIINTTGVSMYCFCALCIETARLSLRFKLEKNPMNPNGPMIIGGVTNRVCLFKG